MGKTALPGNAATPITAPIAKVETTPDTLTGRGGLALFSHYVCHTGVYAHLERCFGPIRKSAKGLSVSARGKGILAPSLHRRQPLY